MQHHVPHIPTLALPIALSWCWKGAYTEDSIRNFHKTVIQYPPSPLLSCPPLQTTINSLQILGNNECFEPYTSNIYVRRVLSGEFTVVNQHLLMDLTRLGLWSPDLKNELVAANGSIQVGLFPSPLPPPPPPPPLLVC